MSVPSFLPLNSSDAKGEKSLLRTMEMSENTSAITEMEYNNVLNKHLSDSDYRFNYELLQDNKQAVKENMENISLMSFLIVIN